MSQLYHAPWIDAVRATTPGALLLGHGFLWSDLACYAVGIALAALLDLLTGSLRRRRPRNQNLPPLPEWGEGSPEERARG